MDERLGNEVIVERILFFRGKRVMIDRDLADLYCVRTKVLNQAVKRNIRRFPEDFVFQLTAKEFKELVTICDRFKSLKHSATPPFAFTEQGVAMLSSVLHSERAVAVNIQIMRTFVILRRMIFTNIDLRHKIEQMERKYDKQFLIVFQAIKKLLEPAADPAKSPIGFRRE